MRCAARKSTAPDPDPGSGAGRTTLRLRLGIMRLVVIPYQNQPDGSARGGAALARQIDQFAHQFIKSAPPRIEFYLLTY